MNEADHEKCLRSRISRHPVSLKSLSNWFAYFIVVRFFEMLMRVMQEFNALSGSLTVMSKGWFVLESPS